MKIGIDISLLSNTYDGIGTYIYNQIEFLVNDTSDNDYYLYSSLPIKKIPKLDDRFHVKICGKKMHILWLLFDLPRFIKKDKIDVFWQPNFLFPIKLHSTKLIVTIHDLSAYSHVKYSSTKNNILHHLFLKRTCNVADKIIAISNDCKQEIVTNLGIEENKIAMIYNGKRMFEDDYFSEEEATDILTKFKIKKKEYILFVGTLSPRKNDKVIIDGFINYKKRGGKNKIVIAGKIAAKSQGVYEIIKESGFSKDIILTGYISDDEKKILYYNSSYFVFPSRLEGFGFPLLEAMQAKIPVITSNVSCMPEIAGDAALYLNNIDDSSELADLFYKIESMKDQEMANLIQKGLERVEFFESLNYRKQILNQIMSIG